MFTEIDQLDTDPVFSLHEKFIKDARDDKVDIGIGVFRNEQGLTPIMASVKIAEQQFLHHHKTKVYKGLAGNESFNTNMLKLLLLSSSALPRSAILQTPGGTGASKILSDYIFSQNPVATVWISKPGYENHTPVFKSSSLNVGYYDYLNAHSRAVDVDVIINTLRRAKPGDVVLLHGCCHNPTGSDLSESDWLVLSNFLLANHLVPFIDIAYHGLGEGLAEDLLSLHLFADIFEEMFVSYSCSKNFGLYSERVGASIIVCKNEKAVKNVCQKMSNIALTNYAMPPNHGAEIVNEILSDQTLFTMWINELKTMRAFLENNRRLLYDTLSYERCDMDFSFILGHKGLFSLFGWSDESIERMRVEDGVYVVQGGRVNFSGINQNNVNKIALSIIRHCYGSGERF